MRRSGAQWDSAETVQQSRKRLRTKIDCWDGLELGKCLEDFTDSVDELRDEARNRAERRFHSIPGSGVSDTACDRYIHKYAYKWVNSINERLTLHTLRLRSYRQMCWVCTPGEKLRSHVKTGDSDPTKKMSDLVTSIAAVLPGKESPRRLEAQGGK